MMEKEGKKNMVRDLIEKEKRGEVTTEEEEVKDLAEKLRRRELTPKEALKKLKERGLTEQETWEIIAWVIYLVLWFPLNFYAKLPPFTFPTIIIYVSIVFVAVGTGIGIWQGWSHKKKGGLEKAGEAIFLRKDGLYKIMRHPGGFGFMMWPILLPIIISGRVPFTLLSLAAIVVMMIYCYVGVRIEEKLNVKKWGDEYRQYMKEVPRFNFILGIWRWTKRKRK